MKKETTILYIEDDETLSFITSEGLKKQGFKIIHCSNGFEAFQRFNSKDIDICLVDVMLPKMDGFSFVEKIREKNFDVPILFISARSLLEDRVRGLKIGADDYITKPYSMEELILRIHVFLKRSQIPQKGVNLNTFQIGSFTFDFKKLLLKGYNKCIKITLREAELLRFFIENKNRLITREELLETIWGNNSYFSGRSLDVFISRLRKLLKQEQSCFIENRHGIGFIFRYNE